MQLGDFADDAVVDFKWSTNDGAGASMTRATNGTVSVYIGNGATQVTAGVTDSEDFDSLVGIHHCRIDLSADAAYVPGSECQVVLSGATIDGETVNAVLAHFSIERAGGILALVKGANGLAAIKGQTAAIEVDTADIQTRIPAALVSGRIDSSVGAMEANVMTAAAAAADLTAALQSGLATAAALATVDTVVDAIQAKTDNLPTDPATQTSVDVLPTNAELAAALTAALVNVALEATAQAIKAKTDLLAFTSGRVHADAKAVAGEVLQLNGVGGKNIGSVS